MATEEQIIARLDGGWAKSKYCKTISGKKGIDTDGYYGFQCKDLVNDYSIWLGRPFTAGNAEALWRVKQNSWWKRVAATLKPKIGDVFVMWYSSRGVEYGHTGVVRKVYADGHFLSLDQNWVNSSLSKGSPPAKVSHQKTTGHKQYAIRGFLRPVVQPRPVPRPAPRPAPKPAPTPAPAPKPEPKPEHPKEPPVVEPEKPLEPAPTDRLEDAPELPPPEKKVGLLQRVLEFILDLIDKVAKWKK